MRYFGITAPINEMIMPTCARERVRCKTRTGPRSRKTRANVGCFGNQQLPAIIADDATAIASKRSLDMYSVASNSVTIFSF
jgi:hypothetical protein